MIGYRFRGWRGSLAALGGILGIPFFIILGLGALYQRFGELPITAGLLRGISAVAAGLVLATGIKLAQSQPRTWRGFIFGLLALAAVGIWRAPLGWTMLILIPLALFTEWRASR
jgi:chromate transporter